MTLQRVDQVARIRIPEPDRTVIGAADDGAAVGAHRHGIHRFCMALEGAQPR